MKIFLSILIMFCLSIVLRGQTAQNTMQGSVSFVSTQNVYVKFENTDGCKIGDTLYIERNKEIIPALIVSNLSSISCVCSTIGQLNLPITTSIISKRKLHQKKDDELVNDSKLKTSVSINDEAIKAANKKSQEKAMKPGFDGRLSLSSNSDFSTAYRSTVRSRSNLSLNARHVNGSKFSAETNISFSTVYVQQHTKALAPAITMIKDTMGVIVDSTIIHPDTLIGGKLTQQNLNVYTLAVNYDLNKTITLSLGRKINLNMANIGAVDGIQFEKKLNKEVSYGALIGSRPDYYTYSFNPNLMQYGAFISHNIQKETGNMQTSFAFFNQTNNFKTDRRFAYFQHSNSLLKNVDLFFSLEADFYALKNWVPTNTFDLTSTYVSLRYQPWRILSLSMSYDARKNVQYYETFKNRADSILDKETRQGVRFQFTLRPLKYVYWGATAGYRFQNGDTTHTYYPNNRSLNITTYLNYSKIPLLDISATINATLLETRYMNGRVYGITLSRDFIQGELFTEFEYRMVDYTFLNGTSTLKQDIAELSLSWRLSKKLMISADYELSVEDGNNLHSVYLNLTKRF